MELTEYRQELDKIDREIVRHFVQRMEISSRIGAWKLQENMSVFQPERERQKLEALLSEAPAELHESIAALYGEIFALSRKQQLKAQ